LAFSLIPIVTNENFVANAASPSYTSLSLSRTDSPYVGDSVTATAIVTPSDATGPVYFEVKTGPADWVTFSVVNLADGKATSTPYTFNSPGVYQFIADYCCDANYFESISQIISVTVNQIRNFTITTEAGPNGFIQPAGPVTVAKGATQTFAITPDPTYHISNVVVDGTAQGPMAIVTFSNIQANHDIVATFTDKDYTVAVISSHGSPTPSTGVFQGDSFTASVTSPDGDSSHRWICTGYSIDGADPVLGTSYTFVNIQRNHVITFNWQEQYYLTVSSPTASTTGTGWYNAGSNAVFSVTQTTEPVAASIQNAFEAWTGSSAAASPTATITMNAPAAVTATWKTQFYLAVDTNPAEVTEIDPSSISGAGWYDEGLVATITAQRSVNDGTNGNIYVFQYWTGDATLAYSGLATNQIVINAPKSVTANFKATSPTSVFFQYLIVQVDPSGIITIPGQSMYLQGTNVELTAPPVDGYTFNYWDLDGTSQSPALASMIVNMNADHVATARYTQINPTPPPANNYVTITFSQTGIEPTFNSNMLTIDGNQYSPATLPITMQWEPGSTHTFAYALQPTAEKTRYHYANTSGLSTLQSETITANTNGTITANYFPQYLVSFTQTGLDASATGATLTLGSSSITYASLSAATYWVDDGASVSFSYSAVVSSLVSGKQYRLTSVNASSPFKANGPVTVAGNFVPQFLVSFSQIGLDNSATGSTLTVDGAAIGAGDLPIQKWADSGSTIDYVYSPQVSGGSNKQFALTTVSGSSSGFTVTYPAAILGNYKTQYKATFSQSGLDSSASGAVVNVAGSPKSLPDLPFASDWIDAGATIDFTYITTVSSSTPGKQFSLQSQTDASPVLVKGPIAVSATYLTQYMVTFNSAGLDSSASGAVVTVAGTSKSYNDLPFQKWVNSGSTIPYSFSAQVLGGPNKRFTLTGVSVPDSSSTINGAISVVGTYKTQYQVTFDQSGLDSSASGTVVTVNESPKSQTNLPFVSDWIDSGSQIHYSYQNMISSGTSGKRFQLAASQNSGAQLTITAPTLISKTYSTEYYLNVLSSFGNPQGSDWYNAGSTATYGVDTPIDQGNGTQRMLLGWFGSTNTDAASSTIIMSGPSTITANWQTQYLVTFNTTLPNQTKLTVPGVPTTMLQKLNVFGAYYPENSIISAGPSPETVSASSTTEYVLKGWTVDANMISMENSLSITVDKPHDLSLIYETRNLLTINAAGVYDPFTATVTLTASAPIALSLTPLNPATSWVLNGALTKLTITNTNNIGHGNWAIFQGWSNQNTQNKDQLTFTMSAPTSLNANFSKVNPVAESLPFSFIAALIAMGITVLCASRKKNAKGKSRVSIALGAVVYAVAIAVSALVSITIAGTYGINTIELIDFTNWAVILVQAESLAFLGGSVFATKMLWRRNLEPHPKPLGHLPKGKEPQWHNRAFAGQLYRRKKTQST
jgi:hypothetical protein